MWRRPRLVTADTKSPAPQPGRNAWWRGAFAPDPATGTEAGPGPTTPRRSAVRRASRLRGRAHASQAWRRALLARLLQGWTPPGAPPTPLALGSAATQVEKEEEKNPDEQRAGSEETGLFDSVNRKRRERRAAANVALGRIASTATRSCPGRARASARLFARGAKFARESRDPGATRFAASVTLLGPGSRCARPGYESGARPSTRLGAPSFDIARCDWLMKRGRAACARKRSRSSGCAMKVFLAGASGAIGRRLVPLLLRAGHEVTGTTRSPQTAKELERAGVTPAVLDIFDAPTVIAAVGA